MNKKRPINLDLRTLHFPVMAIVSILHRLSGIALFLLLPLALYCLQLSLQGADSYAALLGYLLYPLNKGLLWIFCTALSYHMLAGVRHMVMDCGIGESVRAGHCSAWIVIGLTALLALLTGIRLW